MTGLGALRAALANSHTGLFGLLYNFSVPLTSISKQKHSRAFSPPSSPVAYPFKPQKKGRTKVQPFFGFLIRNSYTTISIYTVRPFHTAGIILN